MRVTIKRGVALAGLRPEIVLACFVVFPLLEEWGQRLRITSGTERAVGRVKRTLHIVGHALDFGLENMTPSERDELRDQVGDALGDEFDVLIAYNRLHVEYQPEVHR